MTEGEIERTEDCTEVGSKKGRREEQTGRARERGSPGCCSLLS